MTFRMPQISRITDWVGGNVRTNKKRVCNDPEHQLPTQPRSSATGSLSLLNLLVMIRCFTVSGNIYLTRDFAASPGAESWTKQINISLLRLRMFLTLSMSNLLWIL